MLILNMSEEDDMSTPIDDELEEMHDMPFEPAPISFPCPGEKTRKTSEASAT